MEQNKAEFYKLFLAELQRKKTNNSSDAKAFEEKLFGLIGNELDSTAKLGKIEEQVKRVSNKFDVIDSETEKRALFFYKGIPETSPKLYELKQILSENYINFELSLRKEDLKLSCKYVILQLEAVLLYIDVPAILTWINTDANRKTKYKDPIFRNKIDNIGNISELTFKSKCFATITFYKLGQFNTTDFIFPVYSIRNFESHPFTGYDAANAKNTLAKIQLSPHEYFSETYRLILAILHKGVLATRP
ncbi:MAG: hypothetical protein POELPBGB_02210 [Bacteroidia bacterium]|nr:hypothetical protein [Bacteroidia bacterium]